MEDLEAATIDDVREFSAPSTSRPTPPWSSPGTSTSRRHGGPREPLLRPGRRGQRRGAARHPEGAGKAQGAPRDGERSVAAAGRGRRPAHHLRRPSRLLPDAHRRPRCCPTATARASTAPGLRQGAGGRRVRRRQPDRAPEPVLRRGHRPARAVGRRRREGADRRAREDQDRRASPTASCSAPRTSSRATTSSGARASSRSRRTWRTPRCCTPTSPPPTASSTSSRTYSKADVQRVSKTYFTPESRVILHVMPKGGAPRP